MEVDIEMPPPEISLQVGVAEPKEQSEPTIERPCLSSMLRLEIEFPQIKVINLIDEYNEYLEEHGLEDEREYERIKNQPLSDNQSAKDDDDEQMPDIKFKEVDPDIRKKKNCHYHDKIKDLISRIERDGNIAN